jgi:hypothetical protein
MGFNRSLRMGVAVASFAVVGWVGSAQADIVSVGATPVSSAGIAASIISAPSLVENSLAFNSAQQGFNERQDVWLSANLQVDGGSILAGTLVSSHMIFLNQKDVEDGTGGTLTHKNVKWEFDGEILGVMSDYLGNFETASTDFLGAVGTSYPATGFRVRGMEGSDDYSIADKFLTVDMYVSQPGNWIRVVTAAPVPVPAAAWMGLILMGGLGLFRKLRPTG